MDKACNKCHEVKPLDLFAKGSKYNHGRRNICKKCHADYMTKYYAGNPEKRAEKIRSNSYYKPNWKRHKTTEEAYIELVALYNGKCHVCKTREANNIDHDHACCDKAFSCGKCVRGVLCNQCNTAMGLIKDDPEVVQSMLQYLTK